MNKTKPLRIKYVILILLRFFNDLHPIFSFHSDNDIVISKLWIRRAEGFEDFSMRTFTHTDLDGERGVCVFQFATPLSN